MQTPQWSPIARDYEAEAKCIALPRSKGNFGPIDHPLMPTQPKTQRAPPPPLPTPTGEYSIRE